MKKNFLKSAAALALIIVLSLSGCALPSYDNFKAPEQGESTLKPSGDLFVKRDYHSKKAVKEKTEAEFSSGDGRCVIEKKESYYDITLDYSKGSSRQMGTAYAKTVKKAFPGIEKLLDRYLYGLLDKLLYQMKDHSVMTERALLLKNSLDKQYQDEIDGAAEVLCSGKHGFKKDNKLSVEEYYIITMVPDSVRPTSCSAITVNGNKTKTGHRLSARLLEWDLGEKKELTEAHAVIHFKNGSKSFTSVALLGMLDVLTVVNDDGVMAGILDVGSSNNTPFSAEGKTCYTFALRKAIENCSTAKSVADYMADNSGKFTYNHNIFVCDDKDAFCVEDVADKKDGKTVIRDGKTELNADSAWDDPDCLCVVNSYVSKGNASLMKKHSDNIVRWKKYNQLFCGAVKKEKIDAAGFKEQLTAEKLKDSPVDNIRSEGLVHILLTDFKTKSMQAVFTGKKGVSEEPVFVDLGKYK